jgi:hypothetical protein
MFFLVPVEVVDAGDFFFDLIFDLEDFVFGKASCDGFVLFSEDSDVFIVVESKNK